MEFEKEALIAALVIGAGGSITISKDLLAKMPGAQVVLTDNQDNTYTFTVEK